jgi:hypothetical protein
LIRLLVGGTLLSGAGTDVFESWTAAERDAKLQKMDEVFVGFNIKITSRVMLLAEAFG